LFVWQGAFPSLQLQVNLDLDFRQQLNQRKLVFF